MPIRVVIADDSPTAIHIIESILKKDPDIQIVGRAVNGKEAVAFAESLKPDVMTVDIHMPVMDGLEAIRLIMANNPLPILVVTSNQDASIAFKSLSYGALEVVEKPKLETQFHNQTFEEFTRKIKMLARVKVITHISGRTREISETREIRKIDNVVGIVASTGGPRALALVLSELPAKLNAAVLIVQHIAEGFTEGLVDWLSDVSPLKVKMARAGEDIQSGTVYVAPHGWHLEIDAGLRTLLTADDAPGGHRPSGNVLFNSMARNLGARACGVILTGMGRDGAEGLLQIKIKGGMTAAQDEASSLIYGMPKAAVENAAAQQVLSIEKISGFIVQTVGKRGTE